jgi:glucokinase
MATSPPRLVADIGGTHARFALVDDAGAFVARGSSRCREHGSPAEAARAFLTGAGGTANPREAAFAVAGPVDGDFLALTNCPWQFSLDETRQALGLERLLAVNDFQALALALPHLGRDDLETWNPGQPRPGAPLAVLGPGTGLGVGAAIPTGGGWTALATEGGHRDLAATTAREWAVCERLAARFGRVSVERVLSGPGLGLIASALAELAGEPPADDPGAAEVVKRGEAGDPLALEVTRLFSGWLGAVAGDLALTLGARGGVYLGGGVPAKMGALFDRDRFLERFADKGRFRGYLEEIPVAMLRDPEGATLAGAARSLG